MAINSEIFGYEVRELVDGVTETRFLYLPVDLLAFLLHSFVADADGETDYQLSTKHPFRVPLKEPHLPISVENTSVVRSNPWCPESAGSPDAGQGAPSPQSDEFLCEFRADVLSVDTSPHSAALNSSRAEFVTRHNASCVVDDLDSASIPILGHFPCEFTGKSLFSLVSAEDAEVVKQAHLQLHANQIVSTPGIRLVRCNGDVVLVDSEWSALINPSTNQIDMVVGRHTVVPRTQQTETENVCSAAMTQIDGGAAQQHHNLGAFIEGVEEDLVGNGGQSSTPQSVHKYEPASPSPAQAVSDWGTPVLADGSGSLSYNQISCLDRVLKSQNHTQELPSPPIAAAITIPSSALTRELLQQHERRWESDCKDTWNKRLTQKRRSSAAAATTVKMARRCAELPQEDGSKVNSVRSETAGPTKENYQAPDEQMRFTENGDFDNDEDF